MNYFEVAGFITGIIGIWLTIRQNIWCFPVGLINVIISLFLFLSQRLYSDSVQQLVYIILLSYGWYRWKSGNKQGELSVSRLKFNEWLLIVPPVALIGLGMGYFFKTFTDADLPWIDAFATALSFMAQFLIAKKKIENWFIWIIVNILYIGIYIHKDLNLYAILFFCYLLLALYGLYQWRKDCGLK